MQHMNPHNINSLRPGSLILLGLLLFSVPYTTNAQVTIKGAVFGGGRQGNVTASGDATQVTVKNGTIKGNIYGGGEKGNTKGNANVTLQGGTLDSTSVFGGARMADVDGQTNVLIDGENIKTDMEILNVYGGNDVSGNITGTANVRATRQAVETDTIYVHNLYGGGNGDYDYTASGDAQGGSAPTLASASINLESGCYDQVFGGGNSATITTETTITLNNLYALKTDDGQFANGDVNQFKRVFGGNNKVAMAIQPTWDLNMGSITDLYSGGNKGAMTYKDGIALAVSSNDMTITNMYGGCRMADVHPSATPADNYGAHVLVTGGKITNVYGGNDISGDVWFGSKLDILSSIIGDVYGGGNGSYAYTDKVEESEYYYAPGSSSIDALNLFRPNAAKVLLHIAGTDKEHPTYVGGSVYCGGNSATLRAIQGGLDDASAIFQIGSHAILNNVFLGSNGVNMISNDILSQYADNGYSSLNLKDQTTFDKYMQGVEVAIRPGVSFVDDYTDYSTQIGSLYCGGNVGSMSAAGTFEIDFLEKLVIFNKLVGGCNNANVAEGTYNAAHEGGLTTHADTKVHLLVSGIQLEPKELTYADGAFSFAWTKDAKGDLAGGNIYGGCYASGYIDGDVIIDIRKNTLDRIPAQFNLDNNRDNVFSTALSAFGGGYGAESTVRGNTTVNISKDPESDAAGNIVKVFGGGEMGTVTGNATINLTAGSAGKIYGGGFEGPITGNTAVYLDGGTVYDAFAGACNANIGGSAKMLMGTKLKDLTSVTHNVYGANDFGGTIATAQTNAASVNGTARNVRSNTYVRYLGGTVAGDIFGGACGSYDYSVEPYSTKAAVQGFTYPEFTSAVTGGDINANSFVDIANPSTDAEEKISGSVYGGGRGYLNETGIVDMNSTYVLLHGSNNRESALVNNVFGGGYYSIVGTTTVDACTGYYKTIYGGTYGATASTAGFDKNYACTATNVNTYAGLTKNSGLVIFGGGSYAGAGTTNVTLNGGAMAYVYGGSYNEGYCATTNVSIPDASTASVTALYGGGYGSDNDKPCDVGQANVTFASGSAYVADAIYGGNRSFRATKSAVISISKEVRTDENSGNYATVYGGGHGENTISGTTKVNLLDGAKVATVFGGGRDGQVLSSYDHLGDAVRSYYPAVSSYANWTGSGDLTYATASFKLTETKGPERGKWKTPETVNGLTYIDIQKGATVLENVYGGGKGAGALVAGSPYVKLDGGTVNGNIYGGGYAGAVQGTDITAYCQIYGGSVQNVYGGGYQGDMGTESDRTVSTMVEIGVEGGNNFHEGRPTVLRSVYGGGEMAKVYGTSRVKMNAGYVGYKYNGSAYVENLSLESGKSGNTLLKENGNLFGAGYGEGAVVDYSEVYMYDGNIRNGLYGGGEIAAVGWGTTHRNDKGTYVLDEFSRAGETHIYMYGGHVFGDVFGGGRGFSYDLTGNEVTGKTLYTDGYVFGTTDVNIFRGTVGTQNNIRDGFGNVFGGGNIGYIYADPNQYKEEDGRYYKVDGNRQMIVDNGENILSEDCRVYISAYAKVTADGGVNINGKRYEKGEYVPTDTLNSLSRRDPLWTKMDSLGITIENAVFAGGNVSSGSDKIYANAKTIFGNATASVIDLYSKDFIIISNDGIGGMYGEGNLTFVDGYSELNITNYGTDYYSLNEQISIESYNRLTRREKAYYELKFRCTDTYRSIFFGQEIVAGTSISAVEYDRMTADEQVYWESAGFCTLYAGRMMNTLQRTDFCGVFGSRMVLRGARDRVPDVVDYTDYTINRVEELSLNKVISPSGTDSHGNYFGIFNVVNLLGAITSDVDFHSDIRTTTSENHPGDGSSTYYGFKYENRNENFRNNASSHNQIALASGVYLELVRDYDNNNDKLYGPITGVIELDLVNVKTGEGGGYVYAENLHGNRSDTGLKHITLTAANRNAVSKEQFTYTQTDETTGSDIETSGNFVHSGKRIVDDCYPKVSDHSDIAGQCHYWYIKGDFYVYNQYISAYTGAAQPYTTRFDVPMVITPQSDGKMVLKSVKPNKYAYFVGMSHTNGKTHTTYESLTKNDSIFIESNMTQYKLNEPISQWDYDHLSEAEKRYFTDTTYVVITDAQIGDKTYAKGDVMLPRDYDALPMKGTDLILGTDTLTSYLVRETNAVSNERGFLLTLDFNNPKAWDNYYTKIVNQNTDDNSIDRKTYLALQSGQNDYLEGPSLLCNNSGIYGQKSFDKGVVVGYSVFQEQETMKTSHQADIDALEQGGITQAKFGVVWVARESVEFTDGAGTGRHVMPGGYLSNSEYSTLSADNRAKFSQGRYCKKTFSPSDGVYIILGEVFSCDSIDNNRIVIKGISYTGDFTENFEDAYICETGGMYGGTYFEEGKNYDALQFCGLDSLERKNYFTYNYDAFDALRADFAQDLRLYSREGNGTIDYSLAQPVNYQAKLIGSQIAYYKPNSTDQQVINTNDILDRTDYEAIPNEMAYWRPVYYKMAATYTWNGEDGLVIGKSTKNRGDNITESEYDRLSDEERTHVTIEKTPVTTYIIKKSFEIGNKQYTSGHTISAQEYESLAQETQQEYIDPVNFDVEGRYYYCVTPYTIGDKGGYDIDAENPGILHCCERTANNHIDGTATPLTKKLNDQVDLGTIVAGGKFTEGKRTYMIGTNGDGINYFDDVANFQKGFILLGDAPNEVSTLYVPRQSVILDYNQDRIVTVIYQYNYTEVYDNGYNSETQEERHIINIRMHFEDGVPTIGEITPPATVLPSSVIGLREPSVIPGAFEILGGGWEIFETEEDAKYHRNGQPYINEGTPMYWYNDGYQVEYYAKTYAGKTYSNPATLSVANYHRLEQVMSDPEYLHIDTATVKRAPKIYVDGHELTKPGLEGKSELDLLYDLFTKSITPPAESKFNYDGHITALDNIEVILQSDVAPKSYAEWPQLGTDDKCYEGNLHGQGYTVNGLDKSLFKKLCGNVYNLGVTGTFTSGGVSDNGGHVENVWISTEGETSAETRPVIATGGVIVNSYYSSDEYASYNHQDGDADVRPESDFLNGSVAYDLNRYYLEKRYQDQTVSPAAGDVLGYKYMQNEGADTLAVKYDKTNDKYTSYYTSDYATYLPWNADMIEHPESRKTGYIEHFYADGDYRYAQGVIKTSTDERHNKFEDGFYPIWPDDYIIFGQTLAYDSKTRHDNHPAAVKRTAKGVYEYTDGEGKVTRYENAYGRVNPRGNRVYRAQGYYGSSTDIKNVYFNDSLALDGVYNSLNIHKGLTALDLTGYNDVTTYSNREGGYTPALDYAGITGVRGVLDITKNLLVYAPAASGDAASLTALEAYFQEPDMADYYDGNGQYQKAQKVGDQVLATVHGHVVAKNGNEYVAVSDQYLVDNNDFNAPVSYRFTDNDYMWYQRTPGAFVVNKSNGWETISLPFTADVVTTNEKGIITHFYENSDNGHEYWLREFSRIDDNDATKALFKSPDKDQDNTYEIANTFLYDYYYSKYDKKDENGDEYRTYWNESRSFDKYPFYASKKPYLIGFPGSTYYEFDMSGTFLPQNTGGTISRLGKQTVTFISIDNALIGISDEDYASVESDSHYAFKPTYQTLDVPAKSTYLLNDEGSQFVKGGESGTIQTRPFRAYFTPVSSAAQTRGGAGNFISVDYLEGRHQLDDIVVERGIRIWGENMTIWIESTLEQPASLNITTVAGRLIKRVTVMPGTKVSVPVNGRGVYLAGHKKVAVTK